MLSMPRFKTVIKHENYNTILILIGYVFFALLFLFSIYFYKERILFSDSVFQFFKIINFEKINVEASRYGAIIPEFPVLLGIKLNLNLKLLTILYSVSFIVLYFLIFTICTYLLKNIKAGFAVILVLTLCISQSFFHPVTETHQSLVYSVLLFAILSYENFNSKLLKYGLSVLSIGLAFYSHPVALYSVVFVIGYVAIDRKQLKSNEPYILLVLIVGMALTKVIMTSENSYEGKFFAELLNSPTILFDLYKASSSKFFISRLNGLYFWLAILELILLIKLIRNNQLLKLAWHLTITVFFMLITLITYHKGDANMLMERAFMPLALFISIPFLNEVATDKKKYLSAKMILLVIVVGSGLIRIYNQGLEFKTRTEFNQNLLKKTAKFPNRKFIVSKTELDKHVITFWSNSFESLILSSIDKNVPTQTVFPSNQIDALTKYTKNANSVFLGADFWLEWEINNLNTKYFRLPDNTTYKVIDLNEL